MLLRNARLLNLGFFEDNVLAHDGVVLAHFHFFWSVTLILLGGVEKSSACGGHKFNLIAS